MYFSNPSHKLLLCAFFLLAIFVRATPAYATTDTFGMSLEELMQIDVVSSFKKPQQLKDIPAAAFIITSDDIKRSGATNIPEILRMAPGVEVLRVSNNKWAISIRGGAREYSNKLLVMVDGRSTYSPTFSGVFWEALDIPVELIERIDVIRGPGASIWGANAVNGVINVITKSSKDTQGYLHNVYAGNQIKASGLLSYGWIIDDQTHVRAHAKGLNVNQSHQANSINGEDALKNFSAGFRLDKERENYNFMLQGNLFVSSADDLALLFSAPPARTNKLFTQSINGFNAVANWELEEKPGRQTSIQASVENTFLDHVFFQENRTTFDFDYHQRVKPHYKHDLIWGVAGRLSQDKIVSSEYMIVNDNEKLTSQYRLYFNDEIQLVPDRWQLAISAMLEHNNYTGLEFQPSLRLMYAPDDSNRFWCAISRGIRTPSRIERGAKLYSGTNFAGVPLPNVVQTNLDNLGSEQVDSFDIGWRKDFSKELSLDLACFYNKYKNQAGTNLVSVRPSLPAGYMVVMTALNNKVRAEVRGLEASIEWRPSKRAKIFGSYSLINIDIATDPNVILLDMDKSAPAHMASLRSTIDLTNKLQWDSWIKYQSDIELENLNGYTALDTRLAYRVSKNLELSAVCQNVFDTDHKEFVPQVINSQVRETGRSTYLKLEWNF